MYVKRKILTKQDRDKMVEDAFQFYYGLGAGRSYPPVAKRFGVTPQAISIWAKEYGWGGRIDDLEAEGQSLCMRNNSGLALLIEEHPDDVVLTDLIELAGALKSSINQFIGKDDQGRTVLKIAVKCAKDAIGIIAQYQKVLDQIDTIVRSKKAPDDSLKNKNVTVEKMFAIFGGMTQEQRIAQLQQMHNPDEDEGIGYEVGGDNATEDGSEETDYTELPDDGAED